MVANLDCCGAEQENWGEDNQGEARAGNVDNTLDGVAVLDCVRVLPDMVEVQALEREKASVGAVELLEGFVHFQVILFLEPGVEVCLEYGALGLVAERLDKACVVQLVENFLTDGFQRVHVGIEEDNPDTALVGQVPEHVDEPEVREHGKYANTPGFFNNTRGTAPAEEVVLVRIDFDKQEWPAGAVRPQEFLVKARPEETCRIDNVLEPLLV